MDFKIKEQGSGIVSYDCATRKSVLQIRQVPKSPREITFYELLEGTKKSIENESKPVVLTVNPTALRDWSFTVLKLPPPNLMFTRVLTTTWNMINVHCAVHYYVGKKVPVVLTFPLFSKVEDIPPAHRDNYSTDERGFQRITHAAWSAIMLRFARDPMVYSCGQDGLDDSCKRCGNCLREYFATVERIKLGD